MNISMKIPPKMFTVNHQHRTLLIQSQISNDKQFQLQLIIMEIQFNIELCYVSLILSLDVFSQIQSLPKPSNGKHRMNIMLQ